MGAVVVYQCALRLERLFAARPLEISWRNVNRTRQPRIDCAAAQLGRRASGRHCDLIVRADESDAAVMRWPSEWQISLNDSMQLVQHLD